MNSQPFGTVEGKAPDFLLSVSTMRRRQSAIVLLLLTGLVLAAVCIMSFTTNLVSLCAKAGDMFDSFVIHHDPTLQGQDLLVKQQGRSPGIHVDVSNTTGIEDGSEAHPWNTIQEGLDNAIEGDTILVAQGTYMENIVISKTVFLEGGYASYTSPVSWTRSITFCRPIVNGGRNDSVMCITTGCAPTIDGFTITGGSADKGGGVHAEGASPTISHNIIVSNTASEQGSGIYLSGGSSIVSDNLIMRNTLATGDGGGIYLCCGGSATVENNTISYNGGSAGELGTLAGGIYVDVHASATIRNNLIFGNACTSAGGIAVRYHSSAIIESNTISSNNVLRHGGGVAVKQWSTVEFSDNVLTNNTTRNLGGGLYIRKSVVGTFSNNIITGNWSGNKGGGVWIYDSAPMLISNTIAENEAGDTGGGVAISNNASPTLEGNLISGNKAWLGAGIAITASSCITLSGDMVIGNKAIWGGGGIMANGRHTSNPYTINMINSIVARNTTRQNGGGMMIEGASASIVNSTIVDNRADGIGGGVHSLNGSISNIEILNSILWSNGGDDLSGADYEIMYSDMEESLLPGEGNISADPLFVNQTGGDYHLSRGSPVIDAGTDIRAPQFDFEGDRRPFDGDGDGEAKVDMGADEYCLALNMYLPVILKNSD